MRAKLNSGVPVDDALKQMGVTDPALINEIKDDLSYHAINSGAHVPIGGVDVSINERGPGVQGRTHPSVVDINVNGQPAHNGQNGDIEIHVPTPGDVLNAGANAAANAVSDGARALGNIFGAWGR